MIEPVFAQVKNRGLDRFQRRGRDAVRTEWRLITATHNLGMKLLGQVPAVPSVREACVGRIGTGARGERRLGRPCSSWAA
jgi:Transposase DDE domain